MTTIPTHNNTPALRFPDFLNDGEWEVKRLGDCLIQTPDYGINSSAVPFSNNLPTYLRITDISDDGLFIKESKVSVDTVLSKDNSLQEGDIVFARTGASVGKVYKYRESDGPLVFAGFLIRIKPNESQLSSEFLFQYLFSSTYKKWVEVTSTRSGQPGLNSADISSLMIPFPKLAEQQRIAACLSAADEMITATKSKLEQLKDHKKGLMQKLFPTKGKKLPELRFKGFEKDGEWKEKKLEELIEEVKETITDTTTIPLYSLTIEDGITSKTERYERGFLVTKKDNAFKVVSPNDFVSNPMNLRFGAVGYNHNPFKVCVSGYYDVFRFKETGVTVFWSNYLKSDLLLHKYDEIAIGSLIEKRRIYFSNLLNLKLLVPSIPEQCKIADCLTTIDEMINQYTNKVAMLEQHKKGLMQQMFPKMN